MIFRLTFVFLLFSLLSCSKQDTSCSYNTEFCNFIDSKDYTGAANIMNVFLTSIDSNQSDKTKIEFLEKWLKCQPCIKSVEGSCVSCYWSYPAQSYIDIKVSESGQIVKKKVWISMSKTPYGRIND
jgi:hypothetical protein